MAGTGPRLGSDRGAAHVTRCEVKGDSLYPPKFLAAAKPPGALEYISKIIRDPLLALPSAVYEEPIIVRKSPVVLVSACAPDVVRTVLVDRRQDFDRKPPVQNFILGRLLGNGLLLAEGDDWRWQRKIVAPLFRHGELLNYVQIMSMAATTAMDGWREQPDTVHDIAADMTRATYDVIAHTILVGSGDQITQVTEQWRTRYGSALRWATMYGLLGLPRWFPRPGRSVMNRHDDSLRHIADDMIAAREAEKDVGEDLLARLMRARHEETGQPMSREQLVDNALTFLLAGHQTTSMALTWTLYLIACAPKWEERLLNEIGAVVPDGPIAAEHVDQLVQVQQVLKESMRLFPPVPFLARVATSDTELAGEGIPKGTPISIPIYAVHRHQSAWSDPDLFDPDRFSPENEPSTSSCKFLPFGAGPRVCIGAAFALIEATVFLATFLRTFRFELAEPDFHPIPSSAVLLVPRGGMPLRVTARN